MNQYAVGSLVLNVLSFILANYYIFREYKKNNIIGVMYWVVFIVLVIGQGIHISIGALDSDVQRYLGNFITREGHFLASMMVFFIICIVGVLERMLLLKPEKRNIERGILAHAYNIQAPYTITYYALHWGLFFILSLGIIALVGGVDVWSSSDRPVASGSTFFLIGLGLLTYPLLIKLASNFPINLNDKILFCVSLIAILSFSRILAVFRVLILLVIYIYTLSYSDKEFSLSRYIKKITAAAAIIFIFMFVYGSYRHVLPYIDTKNIAGIINYVLENPESSLFSIDLNYRIAIEGMTGLSGVLSEFLKTGDIQADFGISLTSVFLKMIPSFFRDFLGGLPDFAASFYWYNNSVVGGGLEGFFVHFWFFGLLILYPLSFFYLAYIIPAKLFNNISYGTGFINSKMLYLTVIAVFGLHIIRGSTMAWLFYMLAELIILYIAINIFKIFFRRVKMNNENRN